MEEKHMQYLWTPWRMEYISGTGGEVANGEGTEQVENSEAESKEELTALEVQAASSVTVYASPKRRIALA